MSTKVFYCDYPGCPTPNMMFFDQQSIRSHMATHGWIAQMFYLENTRVEYVGLPAMPGTGPLDGSNVEPYSIDPFEGIDDVIGEDSQVGKQLKWILGAGILFLLAPALVAQASRTQKAWKYSNTRNYPRKKGDTWKKKIKSKASGKLRNWADSLDEYSDDYVNPNWKPGGNVVKRGNKKKEWY